MIKGLIACGGKSSRMGENKSLLKYHDIAQVDHIKSSLAHFCSKIYVSLQESQFQEHQHLSNYIFDLPQYRDAGPMSAILSAFHHHPEVNFIMIGCDYPLLHHTDLKKFIQVIKENLDQPIAFFNPEGYYEPLLAYYPANAAPLIRKYYQDGTYSLQKFLLDQNALKFIPTHLHSMLSVDTADQYSQVITLLSKS